MKTPFLSVIMGVYYRRESTDFLERSLRSILDQSIQDFELLVCDDGSSEKARSLLDSLAAQDSRIRLVREGELFDLASKLNACLRQSRGTLIARMDDDDYSHPNRFAEQIRALEDNPAAAFVGSCVDLFSNREFVGQRKLPPQPEVKDFLFSQPFVHPTLIFRREALEAVGGYSEDPRCRLCEDYDLLMRLYERGFYGINLQESLLDYTVSGVRRKFRWRWNEAVTRWHRYSALGLLPGALPYVLKPLVLWLVPEPLLDQLKKRHQKRDFSI